MKDKYYIERKLREAQFACRDVASLLEQKCSRFKKSDVDSIPLESLDFVDFVKLEKYRRICEFLEDIKLDFFSEEATYE